MDVLQRDAAHSHLLGSPTSVRVRACVRLCVYVCVRVLTAECDDVAAVFMDELLGHRLFHDLLHLHADKGRR